MSTEAVISIRDVYKAYGAGNAKTPVLRGVSFEVERGDIVALLGQSGSGKSTLLNIIGSLDTSDSGSVNVLGVDYAAAKESRLAMMRNLELGFIFQSFNLLDHLTCIENVVLPAAFTSMSDDAAKKVGMQTLERVGLESFAQRSPGELSGGQKQRVAIARALFNKPQILLCDEPTGNLDSDTGSDVINFFAELNREHGVTLLLVTHEERLSTFAKRVIRIEDGLVKTSSDDETADSGKVRTS